MFVTADVPVTPVTMLVTAESSAVVITTEPLRPWTLNTFALTDPLDTDRPLPTVTAPKDEVVATGS